MVLGNNVTVRNGVTSSYVLGSRVDVTQSNSVYIGDKSVATLLPTGIDEVETQTLTYWALGTNPTTRKLDNIQFTQNITRTKTTGLKYGADTQFENLTLNQLNSLITAGERGQQAITINDKRYNFAGLGEKGGGVISVGGIRVENGKNVSYGRIIQNVAPGLVGANSTDAINGSQLFAIYNAIDATVKQVVSGDRGPVVYTNDDGSQLLRENNILYDPTVAKGYKRAIDGLWYKEEDFDPQTGALKDSSNIFGRTLADINTNGVYYKAEDGNWYKQEQLRKDKDKGNFVANSGTTGLNQEAFEEQQQQRPNYTVDPGKVILSLVNAERQADSATEQDATKTQTILANLAASIDIAPQTDEAIEAKAKDLFTKSSGNPDDWDSSTTNGELSNADKLKWQDKAKDKLTQEAITTKATALYDAQKGDSTVVFDSLSDGEKNKWKDKAKVALAQQAISKALALDPYKQGISEQEKTRILHQLSQAATLQDIKTAAQAGLDFAGDSGTDIHRNLGEKLTIKGGVTNAALLSANNIGVVSNGTNELLVQLAKKLVGLESSNYGTVTAGAAPSTTTTPFGGFTDYMASAINPKGMSGSNQPLYIGSDRSLYTTSLDNTGLHLGSGTTEKATVALINPQNSLNPDSSANGLSVIFTSANNGGSHVSPTDEKDSTKSDDVRTAYDGKIFGNDPLGLLVGTMAEGSSSTMQGSTGTGFGVFVGFNNGVVPVESTPGVAFKQPTIFNNVTATRSETGNVQNAGGSSAVVFGAFNSISGNGGLAVGTLNRVYGNEGIVIGNTTLANSYSSVGRFGVTMGFNVKAGEWSKQSVVIGSNLQSVGQGNIVLGGGENKFYGTGSGWNDIIDSTSGVYTTLANTFDASKTNLENSGMRFWGDRNIVIGAKNRTEGFNTTFNTINTDSGYSGSAGNGNYKRIADNSVVGTNNSLYDLSFNNSVYGSNNVIASGTNNMVIGSNNRVQAQLNSVTITGAITDRSVEETNAIAALGTVNSALDAGVAQSSRANGRLLFGNNNSIVGSRNTVGFNSVHNFLAGDDNVVTPNASYNFLAGSRNISGVNLVSTNADAVNATLRQMFPFITFDDDDMEANLKTLQNFQLSTIVGEQTGMNLLAGSLNIAGEGAQNNIVQGGNVILRNGVQNTYVFGSHIIADQSRSVYMGDYSVATLTPLTTNKGSYEGNINGLPKNGTDGGNGQTATVGLNDLITAGNKGQTSIQINGKTYNFAGQGYTTADSSVEARSATANDVGVITVGRIVNEGTAQAPNYKSYGRIIQNVAPGLIGANSTDAVNGSQLYAIWDAMESSVARVVTGLDGNIVYTSDEGHRLYSWNNTLYDSALVDGKFKQAANGQWYPVEAFDTQNGNQLKTQFSGSSGFTLGEINQAKMDGKTLTVTGKDGVEATSTAWLQEGSETKDTTSQVVSADNAVLSLVNGSQSTTGNIELYNVANALNLPAAGTTTQSQQQVAVSKLLKGQDASGTVLSGYDFSQATNLKDLQNLALAGMDFTGDTLPANAANEDKKTVHRNLSEALTITGGVTDTDDLSTTNNIGVVASNAAGTLTLRLAKALTGLTSTEYKTTTTDGTTTTTITSSGVTIQGPTPEGGSAPDPISITTGGINAGNTNITNVKSGLAANSTTIDNNNSSYGATLGDVQTVVNAAAWDIGQTTTTTTNGDGGSSTTTSTYTSSGTVNNAERVSFDAGTGVNVSITKTDATQGEGATPETYSVVFAVKSASLMRDGSTGVVSIAEGGDEGGYATAENVKNIFNSLNTNVNEAKFGLTDSTTGKVEKLLNNTIQITGFDGNISTVAAKSTNQAAANDVLKIKLSPTVTLGDKEATGTSGKLTVKNAGQADQSKAVTLSDGAITFTNEGTNSGTYTNYSLAFNKSGAKLGNSDGTTSPRLSFNGNDLATMQDGILFTGDTLISSSGDTTGKNPFTKTLGSTLTLSGGVPSNISADQLTTGNIAVVSNGTDTLSLRLVKDITGINSIAFGADASKNPSLKIAVEQGTKGSDTHNSSVLRFTSGVGGASAPRIAGIFTDTVVNNGGTVTFATKAGSEVVTVDELKAATTATISASQATLNNLFYGFKTEKTTTTGSGENATTTTTTKSRYVNVVATDGSTEPSNTSFMTIKGDKSISVDFVDTGKNKDTDTSYNKGDLQISLNKDLVLGANGTGAGGSITVNGDTAGASVKLDGSSHTLTITSPEETLDGKKFDASTFTLDGRKGKLVFGNNENTATFIDFATTVEENNLSNTALKRITVGTKNNNAPVATMQDGLKFTGNNNDTVARLLNETLEIKGGATVTGTGTNSAVQQTDIDKATTAQNTYVAVEDYNKGTEAAPDMDKRMVIRLAKDMTDLNTITLGGQDLGGGKTASTVKLSTTETVTVGESTAAKTYSALKLGNASGDPVLLRNLAEGVEGSDAATVSQLKNAAWTIGTVSGTNPSTSVNSGDTVNFADGTGTKANVAVSTTSGVDTYTVKFNIDTGSITSNSTTGAAETTDGDNKFVDSKTIVKAINEAVKGATQKYTADNKTGAPPANVTITRKTGETIGLIGGATGTLSDNNIGTVANADAGTITIKLAKNLTGLESSTYTTTSSGSTYTTLIDGRGVTITPPVAAGADAATKKVTLTDKGLFNGNNNITGLTSPLTGLSVADGTHASYGGLSPAFLSTLRDLGVAGNNNKTNDTIKKEQAQLASAATVGDLQNLSNMPIYFSADNYQDTVGTTVAKKLGEQLSIETGKFVMSLKAGTTDTYNLSNYDATSADAYNDENMAIVVKDNGLRLGFRDKPIFTGVRIGTITTQNGTKTENSVAITNTTDYANTDATPTLKIGGDTAVKVTNIASPTEDTDVANKAYVDLAKATVTGTGAAIVTSKQNADHSTNYNVHVDEWLTYTDGNNPKLTNVIKGADGKYYEASAIAGLQYDTAKKQWTTKDGGAVQKPPTPITSAVAKLTTFGAVTPVLSNVAKGQIDENSVDAINGSQLKQLVNKLGLSVNEDKTEITGTFNSIDAGGSNTAPTTVVNAINQLTTAVNKGRVYAGDDYVAATSSVAEQNAITRELGERINIKGGADTSKLTEGNIGVVHSGTDTLLIKLAKTLTGLDSMTFGSGTDNTVINKDGVTITGGTDGTKTIKFTDGGIHAGGQTISGVKEAIAGVTDDDINAKALALYNAEHPTATVSSLDQLSTSVQQTYKGKAELQLTKGSYDYNKTVVNKMLSTTTGLDNAATLGDLKTIANAGLDFVGNNSGTIVHRPLSSTLNIVGEGTFAKVTADTPFQSAADNIYVQGFNTTTDGYKLVVRLAKDLQNLSSATFKDEAGNTSKIEGSKTTYTSATTTSPDSSKHQTTTTVGKDGISIATTTTPNAGNPTTSTVSLTENGLNNGGKTITNVGEGKNPSDVATVSQLNAKTAAATTKVTGSGAATVTSTTASDNSKTYNVHVEKVLSYTDKDGNELVQAADGKYYTATDLNGLVYDSTAKKWKKAADGSDPDNQPEAQTATTAKLASVTGNKAPVLSNVSAGAITSASTDAINGSQLYSLEKDVLGFKEDTGANTGKLVKPTFKDVTAGGKDTTANTTAPTTIVGAIEQLTTAANKGRVYRLRAVKPRPLGRGYKAQTA